MQVRQQHPDDHAAIEALVRLAFGGRWNEPALVERLCADPGFRPELALVADQGGRLVGHAMLSPVELVGPARTERILVLAPVSVHPDAQGRGVGSATVHRVLELADAAGEPAVVVLGDPGYYGRFGFEPAAPLGIVPPDGVPTAAFSARVRLARGVLGGTVQFPAAFHDTETL